MPFEKIINYAFFLYIAIKYGQAKKLYFTQNMVEILYQGISTWLTNKYPPLLKNECIIWLLLSISITG